MTDTEHEHDGPPYNSAHYEAGAMKPGETPHHASMPEGSEDSVKTTKTRVDPHTGEPNEGRPDTAG